MVVVPCPRPVLEATITRHSSAGASEGTKHDRAEGPVLQSMPERRQGRELERVWPLTWVRKAPAPRKKRATETPADSAMEVTVVQGAVGEDGTAPAVTGSSAFVLWD